MGQQPYVDRWRIEFRSQSIPPSIPRSDGRSVRGSVVRGVLRTVADLATYRDGRVWASVDTIGMNAGCGRRAVSTVLQWAEDEGLLITETRHGFDSATKRRLAINGEPLAEPGDARPQPGDDHATVAFDHATVVIDHATRGAYPPLHEEPTKSKTALEGVGVDGNHLHEPQPSAERLPDPTEYAEGLRQGARCRHGLADGWKREMSPRPGEPRDMLICRDCYAEARSGAR